MSELNFLGVPTLTPVYLQGLLIEKAMAETHLNEILARQPRLKPYVTKFEATMAQISQVAKQIDTITNIWQTVINLNARSVNCV